MKAILTKYHGPTNTRGSRISATIMGFARLTRPYNDALGLDENHVAVAQEALSRIKGAYALHTGTLPNGDYCHVLYKDLGRVVPDR